PGINGRPYLSHCVLKKSDTCFN
ncbi:hypothetical protein CP8484711_0683B, partial [Chlamydia psittaci 84-8471/1]